ncbi:MAG: tetratricopeptide repeat protein [Phycisphaeraceae bacterium]|nr:tetratricopeptide repeat protein [Phycisphaeraceae bacterium]
MDSEHRHDLKENDLEDFFRNFREFWEKWGNTLLMAVLAVLVGVLVTRFVNQWRQQRHDQAWEALITETSPLGLEEVAKQAQDPTVSILASLQAGEAALRGKPADTVSLGGLSDARRTELTSAKADFQRVIDNPAADETFKLNAMLGLAAVMEELGQPDEATKLYQQVIERGKASHQPAIAAEAEGRMAMVPRLSEPMRFGPEPVTTQPTSSMIPTPEAPGLTPVATEPEPAGDPEPTLPAEPATP